ncbi:MAG: type II toxin-antitoxin system HicA family toxin [Candidatus Solibacter sp.]|nr:type II toxin-antitoxin system HicA family toxin [Candidatus Solibacter sp.]
MCLLCEGDGDRTEAETGKAGCTFVDARKHLAVYFKGNCTIMPRHPAKEVKKGTVQSILKSLGIKEL